jgi:hypothetical protein
MSETRSEPYVSDLSAQDLADAGGERPARRARRHPARWLAPLIGLLAAAAFMSVYWQPRPGAPATNAAGPGPAAPAGAGVAPRGSTGDAARYPIASTDAVQPPLDASDALLETGLRALVGGGALAAILAPRDLVRSVVATVDNLPRRSLFAANMPVTPAPGAFETTFAPGGLAIAEGNAARYTAHVRLLQLVDAARLVALYERHYPLFAQAYRELGYPNGHFNDRLVEAIEVALSTPEVAPPLRVVQPKVYYEFVDRGLETLPAAQKLLLRMGPENAAIVRAKLAEIHALLTRNAGGPLATR